MAAENTHQSPSAPSDSDSPAAVSTGTVTPTPTVDILLVGDDRSQISLYEPWIADRFTARTASTVAEALDELATAPIAVVAFDDQWLRRHGDALLRVLEQRDEVVRTLLLSTSNEPEFCADDTVQLPADDTSILEAIDTAKRIVVYERTIEALLTLMSRRRTLETHASPDEHALTRINARIETLHSRITDSLGDVEHRYADLIGTRKQPRATEA